LFDAASCLVGEKLGRPIGYYCFHFMINSNNSISSSNIPFTNREFRVQPCTYNIESLKRGVVKGTVRPDYIIRDCYPMVVPLELDRPRFEHSSLQILKFLVPPFNSKWKFNFFAPLNTQIYL
jgi:hypothetical protein